MNIWNNCKLFSEVNFFLFGGEVLPCSIFTHVLFLLLLLLLFVVPVVVLVGIVVVVVVVELVRCR